MSHLFFANTNHALWFTKRKKMKEDEKNIEFNLRMLIGGFFI